MKTQTHTLGLLLPVLGLLGLLLAPTFIDLAIVWAEPPEQPPAMPCEPNPCGGTLKPAPAFCSGIEVLHFLPPPPGVDVGILVITTSSAGKWPAKCKAYRSTGGSNRWRLTRPPPTPADKRTKPPPQANDGPECMKAEHTILIPGPAVLPSPAKLELRQ